MRQSVCLGRALALAVIALGCSAAVARAAAYTESINGDLSGVAAAPTPWALELGANPLTGTAGVNFNTGANDYDLVAFTVPAGLRLDSILVTNYQNANPFALAFFGLQAGTPWLDGFGFNIGGNFLMGWSHLDSTMVDVDLLYEIQDHANDPPFAIPLGSGAYTMLIQDVDTTFDYTLTFYAASTVPEPSTAALLAVGAVGVLPREEPSTFVVRLVRCMAWIRHWRGGDMIVCAMNWGRRRSEGLFAPLCIALLAIASAGNGLSAQARADGMDLSSATVFAPAELSGPEVKAVNLLVEELAARTRRRLEVVRDWPDEAATPIIAVGPASALAAHSSVAVEMAKLKSLPAEGFRIQTETVDGKPPAVFVIGNDERGVLFGVGKLLRSLEMSRDRVALRAPLDVTSAPAMPIRGHQLGYRPKTNSYDGWDLPQWEQYIRELAVFGCNTIELIPPRSDDAADSPHFPRPQLEMMVGMSHLAADYGLDVSIWYPAMDTSYATPEEIKAGLAEWRGVLSKLPRVDAIFLPFGDPGEAPPDQLIKLLERQAGQLERLHPGAEVWVSLQGLTQRQFDELIEFLRTEPAWLTGVVHGPQTHVSVAKLRELLPSGLAIRGYPDITHSMRCEYPVPDWDVAFAMTEGREIINPRPLDETTIFKQYRDHTRGVVTYSEGCNDDVNKMIWSQLGWDPAARPIETLRDYGRYFIGSEQGSDFAQGLLALERNWRGPLLTNVGVMTTLKQFQAMEQAAPPPVRRNWRFQQALYRAHYDAYQRARLIEETAQEAAAMATLAQSEQLGVSAALDKAEAILDRADAPAPHDALSARVKELAEALFQSIHMQLAVEKYGAIDVNRGANLDELDVPLNNRVWLKNRFAELRSLQSDDAKRRAVNEILHWTDPGPSGFYDDLGNPVAQPHLVRDDSYAVDPGFLEHPTVGFRSDLNWRRSWRTHVDGLYQTLVTMHYDDLDPHARYKLRVVYAGEAFDVEVKLSALPSASSTSSTPPKDDSAIEIYPFRPKPQPVQPVEFDIPPAATAGGELTLRWLSNPERGGPGRGCQIAEVWLLRVDEP